jgi:hypothetical protein
MNIHSLKNFDTSKFFLILVLLEYIYDYPTNFEYYHREIRKIVIDSCLLYWKHTTNKLSYLFQIVGYYPEKRFWILDIGMTFHNGCMDESQSIEFSKKLNDVFPEINNIKNLQMYIKILFQIYKNKILWSPRSLGGVFTKKQLEKLSLGKISKEK